MAAGLSAPRAAGVTLRWDLRECVAVSHTLAGITPCAHATARCVEAGGSAFQFQSAWMQRGGLEPRALWGLPRPRRLARIPVEGGFPGTRALLSPDRAAARAPA